MEEDAILVRFTGVSSSASTNVVHRPAEFPKFQDPESDEEDSRAGKMPPSDSEDDA